MANFFRFTHWLESSSACEEWYLHFKKREIPCAIVASESPTTGQKTYAVFRAGKEMGSDKKKYNEGNTGFGKKGRRLVVPTIIVSANGWDEMFGKEKEGMDDD